MRWPWTSVARLDDLRQLHEERLRDYREHAEWLEAQNQRLTDHLVRIKRREVGMHELPAERAKPAPAIRGDVLALCNGWGNPQNQAGARKQALELFRECDDWDVVFETMATRMGLIGQRTEDTDG